MLSLDHCSGNCAVAWSLAHSEQGCLPLPLSLCLTICLQISLDVFESTVSVDWACIPPNLRPLSPSPYPVYISVDSPFWAVPTLLSGLDVRAWVSSRMCLLTALFITLDPSLVISHLVKQPRDWTWLSCNTSRAHMLHIQSTQHHSQADTW